MALRNILTAFFLICSVISYAQATDTAFTKEWNEVDSLISKRDATKSALEKVEKIYRLAKQLQMPAQVVKSLVYRYTLENKVTEENPNHVIKIIKDEIAGSNDETQKAVLYSLLAKQYRQYYNNHRYTLYARKKTAGLVKDDVATWSNEDLTTAITTNYLLSLHNSSLLQPKSIALYDAVLVKQPQNRYLRPTLFDLLAHEALDYFTAGDSYSTAPEISFIINEKKALEPTDVFIHAQFPTKDSSSLQWHALQIFQQLLSFHKNDTAKDAFVKVDLERIEWVYRQGVFTGKETVYTNTLRGIADTYNKVPTAARAWYLLAKQEADKARNYSPLDDTTNRYGYIKAELLIKEGVAFFKEPNNGVAEMKNLLTEINRKQLHTETEKVNVPGSPFRTLVSYRNTDTLFGRIIRIDDNDSVYNYNFQGDYWKMLARLPAFRSFTQVLPANTDHQQHTTEIKIDALPVGAYALLGAGGNGFSIDKDKMSVQFFYVSNISYVKNGNDFFVLNRENGKPISGIKVTIKKHQYISRLREYADETVATTITDKNGYFKLIPEKKIILYRYLFTGKNDHLDIKDPDYNYLVNPAGDSDPDTYEKQNAKVFFFTDRSIYRPGQTVFFKGIAVTRDSKTQLSKLINSKDSGWVYLIDVNQKIIDSVRFGLNSYGSFNGKFILPVNVLTGRFSIEVDKFNSARTDLSVEEYKRPNFDVTIEKIKGVYKLNDSIMVPGLARAFAGNLISGAKVKYTVTRNTRYQYSPLARRKSFIPQTNREVAHGEVVTDADGKFLIRFMATADNNDLSDNLLFDFNIHADVTDLNGETRSSSAKVTIGSRALLLTIGTPAISETDSLKKIIISTTNLGNEKQQATVQLKIYQLQAPERLIRKRYWQRPDAFVLSEKEFTRYFPTDEYDNESNSLTWPVGKTIIEDTMNTGETDGYTVPEGKLGSGYYKIEAITKDKYGEEVKQENYIQLFNSKDKQPAVPAYQFNYIGTTIAEPLQMITAYSGSSANNIYVISRISRPRQTLTGYDFVYRKKGIYPIQYTPSEDDRGLVSIHETYVFDNRLYTHQYTISVPWTNKTLKVGYESYRDKTEPGSAEKWTVTVQGSKGEKAAAELLTSMYDASLDQFRPHSWSVPGLWETGNYSSVFSGQTNFLTVSSSENFLREAVVTYTGYQFDHLLNNSYEVRTFGAASFKTPATSEDVMMKKDISLLDETVVVGYGGERKAFNTALQGVVPGVDVFGEQIIRLRGSGSTDNQQILYVVDGKVVNNINNLDESDIASIKILSKIDATGLYGSSGANGAIIVTTKNKQPLQVRKNFTETAFFFPSLYADTSGKYSFSFTMPEALTQWKWTSFAHTKDLAFGMNETTIVTQKKLMVQPNAPRFVREGDNMEFSAKIVNMSDKEITGQVSLELFDAATRTPVDGWFQNIFPSQYFTAEAGKSVSVKFPIQIPFSFNKPLTWRIVARAGDVSDGEENILPVLTNRMLVTESLPLFLQKDTTQHFSFTKLLQTTSESLTHQAITVEYTSNPVWNAVQALPYLMEYPYECAEQTFNRYYANALASYIVNKQPAIKQVFEQWKKDSSALKSNLQKNSELKQILLEETPWVMEAANENEQKKNIALLFDMARLNSQTDVLIEKLSQMQLPGGGFPWFKGGNEDRYITNYILTGIGKLKRLGALSPDAALRIKNILVKAVRYLDEKINEDYTWLIKHNADTTLQQAFSLQIDYLYMRSFFRDLAQQSPAAYQYYYQNGKRFWIKQNSYYRAELGLISYRNGDEGFATGTILPSLLENTITDTKQGMYWKSTYAGNWYQSPIEHQSMMIAFMSEIDKSDKKLSLTANINAMKTWLLLNKQTNNWKTTIATADACYALLLNGTDWLNTNRKVNIQLGHYTINSSNEKTEAGTGFLTKRIDGAKVVPEMGNITITTSGEPGGKPSSQPSWGAVYWQYFEDLDKITPAASPLSINKKLFVEHNTDKGKVSVLIKEGDELAPGDKIIVRIEIRSDRDMDYLHLKDTRAACMEPVNVLSGYKWQDGLGYYESTRDASTNFFIDHLRKGTYVFEYPLFVTHNGIFSVGLASIQSMYAPEFTSHSEGIKIRVKE